MGSGVSIDTLKEIGDIMSSISEFMEDEIKYNNNERTNVTSIHSNCS